MIPGELLEDCQRRSREILKEGKPTSHTAAVVVVAVWVLLAVLGAFVAFRVAGEFVW
jgi:hypothetical protein